VTLAGDSFEELEALDTKILSEVLSEEMQCVKCRSVPDLSQFPELSCNTGKHQSHSGLGKP
jgi:hypothetical protein